MQEPLLNIILWYYTKQERKGFLKSDMKTVCFLKPYIFEGYMYYLHTYLCTDLLPCACMYRPLKNLTSSG